MFFWTETPTIEIWNQIRYLKSSKNVENLLNGNIRCNRVRLHSSSLEIRDRAYEIASCIRQADEYFEAGKIVGLATRPLQLFYGTQSLVKAVVLANTDKRLSDFEYHGLNSNVNTAKNKFKNELFRYKNNPVAWKIEEEFAITHNGVFPNFCESIDEVVPDIGTVIKFKEILKRIPDLKDVYERHYGENSDCNRLTGRRLTGVNLEYGTLQGTYEIKPLDSGLFKTFTLLFIGLFILSNIVRYKPAFWMKEIEGKDSGSIFMVESFCNLATRRIPNEVLDNIWWENFEFGTPGRMV